MINIADLSPHALGLALLAASDDDFADTWPRLTQEQQGAIPDAERRACIKRYRKLTPWFEASIKRAEQSEKSRQKTTAETANRIAFRCVSEIEAKPINWLWPGRIARGKVSMLAGNPGLGKSQVTASMAAIVTTGGAWPVDRTRCDRGAVVFLSAEDDAEDTIRPRLEAAGADLTRVFILDAVVDAYRPDGGEIRRAFNLNIAP